MKLLPALFLGIALLVGCGDDRKTPEETSEEVSPVEDVAVVGDDLDDPEVREKILAEAVLRDTLEERGAEGAKLFYAPNSQVPYTGWSKRLYDNGKVKTLGHCKNGKADGKYAEWNDNGAKAVKGIFKDGKQEGLWRQWHDNGEKSREGTYKDGKPEGSYTEWHDNGQMSEEGTLKNGKLEGPYAKWHENGKDAEQGHYKNGELEGLATSWDVNGKMIDQTYFKNGKIVFENEPDIDDPEILEKTLGKAVAWETIERDESGVYHALGNAKPYAGWAKKLHANGKVALLGFFKDGKPSGLWTWWDESGKKEDEKRY